MEIMNQVNEVTSSCKIPFEGEGDAKHPGNLL